MDEPIRHGVTLWMGEGGTASAGAEQAWPVAEVANARQESAATRWGVALNVRILPSIQSLLLARS